MNNYIVIFNYGVIYMFICFVSSISYASSAARINADEYIRTYCHYNIEKLENKTLRSVDDYLILENDEIKFVIIVVDGKKIIDAVELKKIKEQIKDLNILYDYYMKRNRVFSHFDVFGYSADPLYMRVFLDNKSRQPYRAIIFCLT